MTRPLLFGGTVRRWQWVGFAVFCLLAGSSWVAENAYPRTLPPLLAQALDFLLTGMVALVVWWPKRQPLSPVSARIGLAGVLLFGIPALVDEWAGSQAGPALFTFVPLFVVVGASAAGNGNGSRRLMMPALLGAAGGLLVLPFALPTAISGAVMMGVVMAAVALLAAGSVWLHQLLRGVGLAAGVWLVCGANAVVLGIAGLRLERLSVMGVQWVGELVRATVFDLPEVFLLLWLLREIKPEQAAARFFFVPLLTVVEGLVLLRPEVNLRAGLGLALMVAGGGALLLSKSDGQEDVATPLGLSS